MNQLTFLVALLLSCNIIFAQNTIKGRIIDQDSIPLVGAAVFIPDFNKSAITDKEGFYEINNLSNGKIKVQFSFISHQNKVETVNLNGVPIELNIMLEATIIESEEIVVTGGYNTTQHQNAMKIEVFKPNLLTSKATPNFAELLTKIPGIDMISKGSGVSKPVIRGLSMNDILILNNGVRFENYQYSSHHPLGIDEFGIGSIEIIKGPASLIYGSDAIGGVINFIKEKPALPNTFMGDYNLQMFSNSMGITQNIGIKGASNKFFGGIRIGQKSNSDYLQGGGEFVPNSRSNEYSIKTSVGFVGKNISNKLYYDFNRQNLGLVENEALDIIHLRGRTTKVFYQQLNTHLLSSQNKLYLANMKVDINTAYQNSELTHFGEINQYEIQMMLSTLTYEAKIYLPSNKNFENIIGFQGADQVNTNLNNRETFLLPDAITTNYSAFWLIQHNISEKLKIQSGLRYDIKRIESQSIGSPTDLSTYRAELNKHYRSFSGSIGAIYSITEKLMFRANIASAFRTPNLAELTSNGPHETRYEIGNQNLKPEKSYEADLSLHFHKSNISIDFDAFRNEIDHYIFISPTGDTSLNRIPIYKYLQSNSNLWGIETNVHVHPSMISWLHVESSFSSVIGKQENGDFLPFIPAHKLNFEIRAEKGKFSLFHDAFVSINSHSAFNQNNAALDETITPGYTLFDWSTGGIAKLADHDILMSISINNIFDKLYIDHLSTLKEVNYFNPGRNITFSLKLPFGNTH